MQREFWPNTGPTCEDMTTCEPSRPTTGPTGESTSSPEDSRASPSRQSPQPQSVAGEPRMTDGCGPTFAVSSQSSDPPSSLSRTCQGSFLLGLETSSGMTLSATDTQPTPGSESARAVRVRRTSGFECFWLPTVTARLSNDGESLRTWLDRRRRLKSIHRNGNGVGAPLSIVAREIDGWGLTQKGGHVTPEWCEWLMGFPVGWTTIESVDSETPSCPR